MKGISKRQNQLFLLSFFLILIFAQCATGESKLHKQMKIEAATVNMQCPINLSNEIRLDSVSVLTPNIFKYNHTYLSDASVLDTVSFKDSLSAELIPQLKAIPQKTFFIENNIVIEYSFKDRSNKYICKISIDPEKLKN